MGAGGEVCDVLCRGGLTLQTPPEPGFSCSSQSLATWHHRRSEAWHSRPGMLWSGAVHCRKGSCSGRAYPGLGGSGFAMLRHHLRRQIQRETCWATVKIQVGGDAILSWVRMETGE